VETVPQTKAWAPKTVKTISANQAQRVRARARWVSVSMISPAHDDAEAHVPLQPAVTHDPDQAPDRHRRGYETESEFAHAEPVAGVKDEHRPRGAERHVEGEDRDRQRPHRGVRPQPAPALADVVAYPAVLPAVAVRGQPDPGDQQHPGQHAHGLGDERQRQADREQGGTYRRAGHLVPHDDAREGP